MNREDLLFSIRTLSLSLDAAGFVSIAATTHPPPIWSMHSMH